MSETSIAMAATVVLWHRNKVFLIQRHKKSGFMGSAHVFPGGRLDDEDVAAARRLDATVHHLCHQRCPMVTDPITATALCIASLRETAEESGIFVCLAADRSWLSIEQQKKRNKPYNQGNLFTKSSRLTNGILLLSPYVLSLGGLHHPLRKNVSTLSFLGFNSTMTSVSPRILARLTADNGGPPRPSLMHTRSNPSFWHHPLTRY